jgi:starch synthase
MTEGKLRVLFAASECVPLCKTGGLADVVGALPKELAKMDVDPCIILPFYSILPESIRKKSDLVATFDITLGWKNQYAGLMTCTHYGRRYYFIDNEEYFKRDALYGYYEDTERYLFFSLAVLEAVKYIGGVDIIHCNDWQSAFIPLALKKLYWNVEGYSDIKTIVTIHNLRFQGKMGISDFISMLRLTGHEFWLGEVLHDGQANMLKAGILNADWVTTVSPTYAQEIKNAFYGETFEDYMNGISPKLSGILNGIDISSFNPRRDSKIYFNYNNSEGKAENKKALFKEYNLKGKKSMVIGMVTRLDRQKGLDLVLYAIHTMLKLDIKFVLLGTGEAKYEQAFSKIENMYPDKVRCFIMYDDALARKIYSASDAFLMPSMFEPCGLGQLIAMRYGALPIVRETGGLKDTVVPYNKLTGEGTGFSFANYNGDELLSTVEMAYDVYKNKASDFTTMVARAMAANFSWSSSATEYKKLYDMLTVPEPNQNTATE